MLILPKAIHRFNAFPINIPIAFFYRGIKNTPKIYRTTKDPEIAIEILRITNYHIS